MRLVVTERAVWNALETVEDPELPLSIVDMGLIYRVAVDQGRVEVDMTFTAMGCPAMDLLLGDVREAVSQLDGLETLELRTVWDPPWTAERLSEEARLTLQMAGVGV